MAKKNREKQREESQLSLSANMSSYPKELSQTDIGVRLSFPMKVFKEADLAEMGAKGFLDFEAIDDNNSQKQWEFRLSIRGKGAHPKPVLSAGWLQYVRAKGLKKGDRVILYIGNKDGGGKRIFKIQAQKRGKVKLFGVDVESGWVDIVEPLKAS